MSTFESPRVSRTQEGRLSRAGPGAGIREDGSVRRLPAQTPSVPSYLIREYYGAHEPAALQLRAFGDSSLLEHLDEAVKRYLRSFERKDYDVAERIFYHMLERAVVQEKSGRTLVDKANNRPGYSKRQAW